jgi:UDP-2,3-diacylglucosamine hydrolase
VHLFISDLHLSPQVPGVTRIFLEFLAGRARSAKHLYILGDLFEVWVGDDGIDDPQDRFNRQIVDALRALTGSGVNLSVLHGNRDFLLGEEFAARTGARLLPDPFVLSLPTWQFVLSHGDLLCTDDTDYQTFRTQIRDPAWRNAFLAKPLTERKAIAVALRQQSESAKQAKANPAQRYLMDLNPSATDDFLRTHGYATFIHGHTHLPAQHDHLVDGIAVERWVLADWHEDQGECLCWDGEGLKRIVLS